MYVRRENITFQPDAEKYSSTTPALASLIVHAQCYVWAVLFFF